MSRRSELLKQAIEARALAGKAQRLSIGMNATDAARLIEYAKELDEKARTLEAQALGLERPQSGKPTS